MDKLKGFLSRGKSHRTSGVGGATGPPDFRTGGLNDQKPRVQESFAFKAVTIEHGTNPPTYAETHLQSSAQLVINVLEDSYKNGYLDEVAARHQVIIVDDNFRLSDPLKNTIRLAGHLIHLCHVVCGANSTTSFMSYRNTERDAKMKDIDRDVMGYLEELYQTTSRDEAEKVMEAFTVHVRDPRLVHVRGEFNRLREMAGRDQDVAHDVFLSFVREQKAVFHAGWKTSELIGARFDELYDMACENSRKQEAALNSLRFSLERALNSIKLQREQKIHRPTNVIVIAGSKLHNSEITMLRQLINQTTRNMTGDMKSEISIQILACWDRDPSSIKGHQDLDDHKKGNEDIYDCTAISSEILLGGPGLLFFAKSHNSHLKEWDQRKYNSDDIVNQTRAAIVRGMSPPPSFIVPMSSDIHFP